MANQRYKRQKEQLGSGGKLQVNYWILSGSKANWQKGVASTIWGVRKGLENLYTLHTRGV